MDQNRPVAREPFINKIDQIFSDLKIDLNPMLIDYSAIHFTDEPKLPSTRKVDIEMNPLVSQIPYQISHDLLEPRSQSSEMVRNPAIQSMNAYIDSHQPFPTIPGFEKDVFSPQQSNMNAKMFDKHRLLSDNLKNEPPEFFQKFPLHNHQQFQLGQRYVNTNVNNLHTNLKNGAPKKPPLSSKKDPNRIKRPMNAFMLFISEKRKNPPPEVSSAESPMFNQLMSQVWRKMTREEQTPYYDLARKNAEEFKLKYPNFSNKQKPADILKKKTTPFPKKAAQNDDSRSKPQPKTCRERCSTKYGYDNMDKWCTLCSNKRRVIRFSQLMKQQQSQNATKQPQNLSTSSSNDASTSKSPNSIEASNENSEIIALGYNNPQWSQDNSQNLEESNQKTADDEEMPDLTI